MYHGFIFLFNNNTLNNSKGSDHHIIMPMSAVFGKRLSKDVKKIVSFKKQLLKSLNVLCTLIALETFSTATDVFATS